MLSPALSQLLERARTRFGLEVEVIDATLKHVYPDGTTALARLIEGSPDLRQSLLGALAGGRPERVDEAGANYHVFPLRRAAKVRQPSALLAVRRTDSGVADGGEAKAWPELARSMVEADFAAADALTVERQQSRRLLATLRFLSDLVETDERVRPRPGDRPGRGGVVRRRRANLRARDHRRFRAAHGIARGADRERRQASELTLDWGCRRARSRRADP